jgi:hypothetical protein
MVRTLPEVGLTATIPPARYSGPEVFRAFVIGAAITAAAIGTAPASNASSLPTSPLPFITCSPGAYDNSSGNCVHDPEQAPSVPPGAAAECRDGDWSLSQHHSGTCSGHGGVAQWLIS